MSRPACLKSRSTSWVGGQWPSAPLAQAVQAKTLPRSVLLCRKTGNPNEVARPALRVSASEATLNAPWPWQGSSGMTWSPRTSGDKPPCPAQPGERAPDDPQAQDNASPSPAERPPPTCACLLHWAGEVQIANHDISRHPATCFATDASSHRLQSVPPPSQDPSPSASCTVVATSVEWNGRPHRQERTVKGRGRWRRRNRMTLKS